MNQQFKSQQQKHQTPTWRNYKRLWDTRPDRSYLHKQNSLAIKETQTDFTIRYIGSSPIETQE
jgi:hypothetical protein